MSPATGQPPRSAPERQRRDAAAVTSAVTTLHLPPRLLGRTVASLRLALEVLPPGAVLALHTADP